MADFSALHVALSGLRAAQVAMDTASHNVSNANTPGYTRQRVELASKYPWDHPAGQIGSGVDVTDIARVRDAFLDGRYRVSDAAGGTLDVRADLLSRSELVLGEPQGGISTQLSALWDSFENLALNPPDMAARSAVLGQLDAVVDRIRDVDSGVTSLAANARDSLDSTITEINGLLARVADFNTAIVDASAGSGTPNDLMDQRDVLLDRLSRLAGTTVSDEGNGSVRVAVNGMTLVSGATVRDLSFDAATGQIMHPAGVAVEAGGEVRGYQQFLNDDVPTLRSRLNSFTVDLADNINSIHSSGYWSETGTGAPLLSYDPSSPSDTVAVAVSDPAQIATAASGGPPFPTFDATIAERLAGLRTDPVAAGGTASIEDAWRRLVADVGQDTATALRSADTQAALVSSAETARESAHGVSVDEELVMMMEHQRMYEAAARVITMVDEALNILINRTGTVGR